MSGLAHYQFAPLRSGGTIVSQNTGVSPVVVVIEAGTTSNAIPVWLCTGLTDRYFTGNPNIIVTPDDTNPGDGNQSSWVQLAPVGINPTTPGTFLAPGAALTLAGNAGPGSGTDIQHWLKVTVPSGEDAQIRMDVKLRVNAIKRAVTT